jgi:hypothetical protein
VTIAAATSSENVAQSCVSISARWLTTRLDTPDRVADPGHGVDVSTGQGNLGHAGHEAR